MFVRALAAPAALLIALAGCAAPAAERADPAAAAPPVAGVTFTGPTDALPVTVRDRTGTDVTVADTSRILAVNGDLVEVVYALGLGADVVARDRSATYPPEAAQLPVIGYQRALTPEPIAAVDPSVVLADTLAGPPGVLDQLRAIAPVVVMDREATLEGPPAKIRAVARALGVGPRGDELADRVAAEIAAAVAAGSAAPGTPRVAVLYLRGPGTALLLGSAAPLVQGAGGTDVATELGVADSAPVDGEKLLAAAPDVLVVTTSGLASVDGVDGLLALQNGALARTPAGQQRRVLAYEDQYLLGFGPRTGTLLGELARDLHTPTGGTR